MRILSKVTQLVAGGARSQPRQRDLPPCYYAVCILSKPWGGLWESGLG